MSITVSDLFASIRSFLDDDNSGMYGETEDLCPAVNAAVDWSVAVFTAAFESNKLSAEVLRELLKVKPLPVVGSGNTKRVDLTSVEDFWTIVGVDPDPVVTGSPTEVLEDTRRKWATKLTLEAWSDSSEDPFSAGTLQTVHPSFIRAAYTGPGQFFGDSKSYILIKPASVFTANKVAIWYLVYPTKVTSGASTIAFPKMMFNILLQKSLNYLSMQHGPESRFPSATEKDIAQIVNLFMS